MPEEQFTVRTPRASRVGLIAAIVLFLLTGLLLYFAYRGWQLHQALGA